MNQAMWRTIQNSSWLLGGLALLGLAFFLWIGAQLDQRQIVKKAPPADVPVEPEKVRFSPTLGMMTAMVPELNLKASVNPAVHSDEFRGASFIRQQASRWTLVLMNVTQEEVIKRYLDQRPDRGQFYYFRIVQPKQPEHFLLTYGSFKSVSEALAAAKKASFELPKSISVVPQQFSSYKQWVTDDMGSEEVISNLAGSHRLYQVRLRAVPLPNPAELLAAQNAQPAASASRASSGPGGNAAGNSSGAGNSPNSPTNSPNNSTTNSSANSSVNSNTGTGFSGADAGVAAKVVPRPGSARAGNDTGSAASAAGTGSTGGNASAPNQGNPTSSAPSEPTAPIADPFN